MNEVQTISRNELINQILKIAHKDLKTVCSYRIKSCKR